MGKPYSFEIEFANNLDTFLPSNFIDGHVIVELREPMTMRGLQLNFQGKAHTHIEWREDTDKYHYSASEKYLDQDVLLFGKWTGQGSSTTELNAGRHTFPFRFQLSQGLPSSYASWLGYVGYCATSKIDRPWERDYETKRLFTVVSILDLNSKPEYSKSRSNNNQKHMCLLCCKSGPITAQFSIERQGWVPGEAIRLYADISNGAGRDMVKSYITLKMLTTCHASGMSETFTSEVACVTRPPIPAFGEDSWTGEQMVIPPLIPSFLVGCNIIDIQYVLQLNVEPSGPFQDLKVRLPIIIGNIPLNSVIQPTAPFMISDGSYPPTARCHPS